MSKKDERYQRRKLHSSKATALISITLVLFMLGLLGLIILHAQKLSEYVKENIQLYLPRFYVFYQNCFGAAKKFKPRSLSEHYIPNISVP